MNDSPTVQVRWGIPAGLAAFVFLCFAATLGYDFVNWDDNVNFLDNPHYRGLGASQIRWMFTNTQYVPYAPLTWLTWGADYVLWAMNPSGYHLTNVVLHTIASCIFFFVLADLLRRWSPSASETAILLAAAAGAAFFAVHPLRVETVAWISGRRDLLSGLLLLLALLFYLFRFSSPASALRCYLLSLAAFAASLLSKPSSLMLPFLLLLLDAFPLRRSQKGWGPLIYEKVPYLALSLLAAALHYPMAQPFYGFAPAGTWSLGTALLEPGRRIAFYLGKTVFPIGLSPIYPSDGASPTGAFLLTLFLAGGTVILLARRSRYAPLLAAWLAFVTLLLPYLGLTPVAHQPLADRYSYSPSIALGALFAGAVLHLASRESIRSTVLGTTMAILITLGFLTSLQSRVWKSSETLWTRAIHVAPNEYIPRYQRGGDRLARGDYRAAILDYTKALEIRPGDLDARINRALAHLGGGNSSSALADLDSALSLNPRHPKALANRGLVKETLGDLPGALQDYSAAVDADPNYVTGYLNRAAARLKAGDRPGALADYTRILEIQPDSAVARISRAQVRTATGELDDALRDLQRAIEIAPDLPTAYYNRALVRLRLGNMAGSHSDLTRALELNPLYVEALLARGKLRGNQGNLDGAWADLTLALRVNPKFTEALANRGRIRLLRGDFSGAFADLDAALRLEPNHLEALRTRAELHEALGNFGFAVMDYTRALSLRPRDPDLMFKLGMARAKTYTDLPGAILDWTHVLQLRPEHVDARAHRGLAYEKLGDLHLAATDFEQALLKAPAEWPLRAEVQKHLNDVKKRLDPTK